MLLRGEPPHGSGLQLDLSLGVPRHQPPAESRQGVHHAVRMPVWRRAVARVVVVLQDPNTLVLKDHLVVIRVADRGRGRSTDRGPWQRPLMSQ